MGRLIYSAITSLDGYVEDAAGRFDWAAPDEQVHAFVNSLERSIGTYLYGRRMYETMRAWQQMGQGSGDLDVTAEFADIWRSADKVVYSRSLDAVTTPRTRLEPEFDPALVQAMKADADRDISVGGPGLAAAAFHAGLVDELHLFLNPVVVGAGKAALPPGVRLDLELVGEDRFDSGVVHLHYRLPR